MAQIFETIMIICFGCSWPMSVYKSWRSRTARGKSLLFEVFIATGYVFGIAGKLITHTVNIAFIFYVINILMILTDICLTIRNRHLDSQAAQGQISE